jgi:multidrug transporter EmrE-like cation transporter
MSFIDVIMMSILKAKYLGSIPGFWVFPLTMSIYALQPILFYFGLSFKSMGIVNILWNSISSILVVLTGIYLFDEKLNRNNYIGIILCISGIILLGID